jgi:WD40 repeat protein
MMKRCPISTLFLSLIVLLSMTQSGNVASAQRRPNRVIHLQELNDELEGISNYVLSPSGKKLVLLVGNQALVVEISSGSVISTFLGHQEDQQSIFSAAFSSDEQYVATGARATAKVWRVEDGKERFTFRTLTRTSPIQLDVYALAFTPDGKKLVTEEGVVQLWDLQTGAERLPELEVFAPAIEESIEFLADGIRFMELSSNGARILSSETLEVLLEMDSAAVALSEDRKSIFAAIPNHTENSGWIVGKDINSGEVIYQSELFIHEGRLTQISRDGRHIILVNEDEQKTKLVSVASQPIRTLAEFVGNGSTFFRQLRFSPDGKQVLGLSTEINRPGYQSGNKLFIWDISDLLSHTPNTLDYPTTPDE